MLDPMLTRVTIVVVIALMCVAITRLLDWIDAAIGEATRGWAA